MSESSRKCAETCGSAPYDLLHGQIEPTLDLALLTRDLRIRLQHIACGEGSVLQNQDVPLVVCGHRDPAALAGKKVLLSNPFGRPNRANPICGSMCWPPAW
jgi:hypothetical protein